VSRALVFGQKLHLFLVDLFMLMAPSSGRKSARYSLLVLVPGQTWGARANGRGHGKLCNRIASILLEVVAEKILCMGAVVYYRSTAFLTHHSILFTPCSMSIHSLSRKRGVQGVSPVVMTLNSMSKFIDYCRQ